MMGSGDGGSGGQGMMMGELMQLRNIKASKYQKLDEIRSALIDMIEAAGEMINAGGPPDPDDLRGDLSDVQSYIAALNQEQAGLPSLSKK